MRETRSKYVMQSNSDRAKRLHRSPWRGAFHLTGGAGFLSEMLSEGRCLPHRPGGQGSLRGG